MCEELKKKKKNGNPLSRSNFQSKSVAFNIDESHPSSLNPTLQFRNNHPHSFVSPNPFTLTYPQKNANTRRYALRTTLDLGSGRNKGETGADPGPVGGIAKAIINAIPIYAEELTTILPREYSRPSGLVMNRKPEPSLPRNIRQDARAFHSTRFKRSRHKSANKYAFTGNVTRGELWRKGN